MIFKLQIGGFYATSFWIKYSKGELYCYTSEYPVPPVPEQFTRLKIKDNNAWATLLIFLSDCKWEKSYLADVLDGIQWELEVKGNNVNVASSGSNAFPENFNVFLGLLNMLLSTSGINKIPYI